MDTITFLEQLANDTHHRQMMALTSHLNSSNVDAMFAPDAEPLRVQLELEYLPHECTVVEI
jgi:hypothetical protein